MNNGLQQFEMALIQNLMPEDANEAMVLVPSLKVSAAAAAAVDE